VVRFASMPRFAWIRFFPLYEKPDLLFRSGAIFFFFPDPNRFSSQRVRVPPPLAPCTAMVQGKNDFKTSRPHHIPVFPGLFSPFLLRVNRVFSFAKLSGILFFHPSGPSDRLNPQKYFLVPSFIRLFVVFFELSLAHFWVITADSVEANMRGTPTLSSPPNCENTVRRGRRFSKLVFSNWV